MGSQCPSRCMSRGRISAMALVLCTPAESTLSINSPVIAKNTPLSLLSGEEASGMPIDSIPLCSVAHLVTSSSQWTALQARIAQQEEEREAKQAEERR